MENDGEPVRRIYDTMEYPPKNERGDKLSAIAKLMFNELYTEDIKFECWNLSPRDGRMYLLGFDIDDKNKSVCQRNEDPATISSQLTRFIKKVEEKRNMIEEAEAECMGISSNHAKKNLDIFLDHLYYYSAYEADGYLCHEISRIFICCKGSVLTAAAAAITQSLITGCFVMLIPRFNNLLTINHLCKVWREVNPEHRLCCYKSDVDSLLAPESSLKISIPQEVPTASQQLFPLLVLDGADIHSVVTAVMDEANLLLNVEPWALSIILIEESQLERFKKLLLQRVKDLDNGDRGKLDDFKPEFSKNKNAEIHHLYGYRYIVFNTEPRTEDDDFIVPLFVLPVRSASEAIGQANHYGKGYAAAVYTEDASLSQWVSERLKVSTVWINCIGPRHPAAPLPFQVLTASDSGHCTGNALHTSANVSDLLNFGTPLGWKSSKHPGEVEKWQLRDAVVNAVKVASNAQPSWASIGGLERSKALMKLFMSCLERLKSSSDPLAEDLNKCSTFFKGTITTSVSCHANQDSGFAITTQLLPVGIVAVYVHNNETPAINVIKVIQGAIAYGNTCVVLLADDTNHAVELLYGSGSSLPKGVVNIVRTKDASYWDSLIHNMDINCLWTTGVTLGKEHESLKDYCAKGTLRIWTGVNNYLQNIGKTSKVSLKTFEPFATVNKYVWRKTKSTYS